MADFWEKLWHGLRGELLRTILLAVTVSILLYTGLQPVSRVVLQSFYTNSDFLQTKTDAVGTLIQQNVAESGISSRQVRRITDWYSRGDQPGGCILRVEKDGVVIYDSALNNVEYYRTYSQASKTLDESAYLRTYPLEFSDGSATLYAYGYFDFAVDEAVRTAEFWLCLVLGIGIVLWAVWKKLNYMETLEQSIRVLEGGQLDYKVPVRGTDELAQMAQSLNEMSASLKQQMEQVQQAQQQRYELVTSLSHDLRTPLTLIKGYAETVRDLTGDDKAHRDEQMNIIVDEADRLTALVSSVMELSKVTSGTYKCERVHFDMGQLCDEVSERYDAVCAQNGWQLQLELPEEELPVYADPDMMQRALHNLLGNAMHHIGKDGIFILRAFRCTEGVRVEVEDHGPGIAAADLPYIFDRYYRSRSDAGKQGTGLGLSITKAIFQQHSFRFGVQSTVGKGTTFWFVMSDLPYVDDFEGK